MVLQHFHAIRYSLTSTNCVATITIATVGSCTTTTTIKMPLTARPWDETVVEGRDRARADTPERRLASNAQVLSMRLIAAKRSEQCFYRPPSVYLPASPIFPDFEPDGRQHDDGNGTVIVRQ